MDVRRSRAATALGAVVLAGAVAGSVTGCGASGGPASARPAASARVNGLQGQAGSAGPSVPPARSLSQRELEQAVITKHDHPGWQFSSVEGRGGDGMRLPVHIPHALSPRGLGSFLCRPVAEWFGMPGPYQYHAAVTQVVTVDAGKKDEAGAISAMRSYAAADAAALMRDLRVSLRTCRTFNGTRTWEYAGVTAVPAPRVGDEAVAFRLTQLMPAPDGGSVLRVPESVLIVRNGATVTEYDATGFPGKPARIPMNVVTAQSAKLARTT